MQIAVCPMNPKEHKRFHTTAHVSQTWEVDGRGNYISEVSTDETVAKPDPNNSWACTECGGEAVWRYVKCLVCEDTLRLTTYTTGHETKWISLNGEAMLFEENLVRTNELKCVRGHEFKFRLDNGFLADLELVS